MEIQKGRKKYAGIYHAINGSLGKKLLMSYIFLAVIVAFASLCGIVMTNMVNKSANVVINNDVPIADIAMEAVIRSERVLSYCKEYLLFYDSLEPIAAKIDTALAQMHLFILMAKYGTDTDDFKKNDIAMKHQEFANMYSVPRPSQEIAVTADSLLTLQTAFASNVHSLMQRHRQKLTLYHSHDGSTYHDIPSFVSEMELSHLKYFEKLSDAVASRSSFTGELDHTQCAFGKFLTTYSTPDSRIMEAFENVKQDHFAVHSIAAEINASSNSAEKKEKLLHASRTVTQLRNKLETIKKLADKRINESTLAENQALHTMLAFANTMRDHLEDLEEAAANRMEHAIEKSAHVNRLAFVLLIVVMTAAVVAALVMGIMVTKMIVAPLQKSVAFADAISKGDLTKTIDVERDDEIGILIYSLNTMKKSLVGIVENMKTNVAMLSDASSELSASSTQIAGNAESMGKQATAVASATEQSSSGTQAMSAAAEEMSLSVNTVATAIEQMSASLNEVARNCQKESDAAAKANTQAKTTQEMMNTLGNAANQIGRIVEVINDIADQTNLLALNATIEAASAGEAGKGFAVVANEVKVLAKQTARATSEISKQIEEMQSVSNRSIDAITAISSIIDEVNSISQTIVSAVEQQSATINEVAKTIGGANNGANEIARNISETAQGLTQISSNIQNVNSAVSDSVLGINRIKKNALSLDSLLNDLKAVVIQFKL